MNHGKVRVETNTPPVLWDGKHELYYVYSLYYIWSNDQS